MLGFFIVLIHAEIPRMTWDAWEVLLDFFRWICQYVAFGGIASTAKWRDP